MPILLSASARRLLLNLVAVISAGVIVLSLQGCNFDYFKSTADLKAAASSALEARNFSEAASLARRWADKAPTAYEAQFSLAQASAQAGDKNAAIVALEQAIKLGLKDDEQIDRCANLDPIKGMAAYMDLLASSFPSRATVDLSQGRTTVKDLRIETGGDKHVVRAGDVVIEVPIAK